MLKNYFRIVWRTIRKNKAFSIINIFGLTLGLACSLLIFLWVRDELSVDDFHTNKQRLYILYERSYIDGKTLAGYYTPGQLAMELKKHIPEVRYATNMTGNDGNFEANGKIIKQDGISADSDFFKMFTFPLVQGNAVSALSDPAAISISEQMARRFFGSPDAAIGKTLRWQNRRDFKVSSVFRDLPANSSQKFDFVINWQAHVEENQWLRNWTNNSPQTAIMLTPQADPGLVRKKLTHFLENYNHSFTNSFRLELDMQPASDLYLHSNFVDGRISGGRIEYVRLFSVVAVFILLIACINFMNLTTARASKRSKEIGIRKVAGAVRGSLIRQFLSEALLISAIAVVFALLLVNLLMPLFNELTGKQMVFPFGSPSFWLVLAAITFLTGVLAGSYPAFFLSAFQPIHVLKGSLKTSFRSILFRKGLVVFQFTISMVLIIGTIVVARQVNYIQHANLGFDRENLVYIPLEGDLGKQYSLLKQETLNMPGVRAISCLSDKITYIGGNITGTVDWEGKTPNTTPQFNITAAGYDLVKTMQLQIVQGRDFSRDYASDSSAYLINEAALAIMKYKDPIGKPLELWGRKGRIIGVIKDFHLASLHEKINPLIIHLSEAGEGGYMLVRTTAGETGSVLSGLKTICTDLNPRFPFSYHFADEEFLKLYKSEEIVGRLSNCFAALAIIISCLGLLGLAMFRIELRRKEIGIRKILGASMASILSILSGEFLLLVLIAMLIASPFAWWAMHSWLADFAYRIDIGWWIFIVAGLFALFIAILTVGIQAANAALVNPVKSLRAE